MTNPTGQHGIFMGILKHLADPAWHYEAVAWLAGLAVLVSALIPLFRSPRLPAWVFPASAAVVILMFRWPAFFHRPEFNVDEAQDIAGAITLRYHPGYWGSVDGTTHGPLNDFVLLLPLAFGFAPGFAVARIVAAALCAGALAWLWAGARALWGEATARLAVLPPLAFFALSTFWDFIGYSSEQMPVFLLAMGWALIVIASRSPGPARPRLRTWALAGLALGSVPFSKLQAIPPAAGLLLAGIIAASLGMPGGKGSRRPALAFVAAACLPTVACGSYLWISHLGHHFWQSYILSNLRYATQTKMYSVGRMIGGLPAWLPETEGLTPYVIGLVAFPAAGWALLRRHCARDWAHVVIAAALTALCLYAAVAPGRRFHHYLLFLVVPLAGLAAAFLAPVVREATTGGAKAVRAWSAIALFLLLGLAPQVVARLQRAQLFLDDVASYPRSTSGVTTEILRHARPGEPLGIWGYMPRFYVETGMPQASREAHNERQILPSPQRYYYRKRYLFDLGRNRPAVFLDAVGPGSFWLEDRTQFGHETWPELNEWLDANYLQVKDIDGIRIYLRVDRLPPG